MCAACVAPWRKPPRPSSVRTAVRAQLVFQLIPATFYLESAPVPIVMTQPRPHAELAGSDL